MAMIVDQVNNICSHQRFIKKKNNLYRDGYKVVVRVSSLR